jgi:hypothetical protein
MFPLEEFLAGAETVRRAGTLSDAREKSSLRKILSLYLQILLTATTEAPAMRYE